jgi:hypothetical protein
MGEWKQLHTFLTSALDGSEWSASHPSRKEPGTHWIGGWVGPRVGLDDVIVIIIVIRIRVIY